MGRVTVLELLRRGHSVFATGRSMAALDELGKEHANQLLPGSLRTSVGDVSSEEHAAGQLREALDFFHGCLDGVVLNAGCGAGRKPAEQVPIHVFDQVFQTNVRGVFVWIQEALRFMKPQRKGQIVVTSSVAGLRPFPNSVVYSSSKFAVQGMVSSLRAELKGTGVKIGTVNPGAIATAWWTDPARGGYTWTPGDPIESKESIDWDSMLAPDDVASAIIAILEQAPSSNIESIILDNSG